MSDKQYYPGEEFQQVFDYLSENHNLTLTVSEMCDLIDLIRRLYPSQPPAVKGAVDDVDPTSENMTTGMVWAKYVDVKDANGKNALSLEGFQKAVSEIRPNGAVWVKCSKRLPDIDNVHDDPTQYIMRCENDGSRGHVHIIQATALEMREVVREWDYCEWLDESPTAAGDGKEAIEFAQWIGVHGYGHLGNGVWAQEGVVNSLTTTAQLYDIFKQQNK